MADQKQFETYAAANHVVAPAGMKPHFSPSQIGMYVKCGEAYRRYYLEKERHPPSLSMLKGTGMHAGAEHNFTQKIASHVDLPRQEIIDAAVAAFDEEYAKGGVTLQGDDKALGEDAAVGLTRDGVANMAAAFAVYQAPDYQPVATELEVRIPVERGTRDLFGIIDLVAKVRDLPGQRVRDFKTGKKKKSSVDVADSIQLTFYAAAHMVHYGQPAADVGLDTLIENKKGISRQELTDTRDENDLNALAATLNMVEKGVNAGVFLPAVQMSSAWWCLSMDTEILSNRGWVGPNDIKDDEVVASFNPMSHLIEWQEVKAIIRKPNPTRRMVTYDGRALKFSVTPDHRMLVRNLSRGLWRVALAADIECKGSLAYMVAAQAIAKGCGKTDDELALAGWLTAEGHFRTDSNMIELSQARTSPYWREIGELLNRMSLPYSEWDHTTKPNTSAYRILAPGAARIRETLQPSKQIPKWLKQASPMQFRSWLAAFGNGDGHQYGTDSFKMGVGQKDESIIDDLQAICVVNRMSAVKSATARISGSGGMFHSLSIMDGSVERVPLSSPVKTHFIDNPSDNVWCVTVPNGFIMTRYKGRTLITGNCSEKFCHYHSSCHYINHKRISAATGGDAADEA